MSTGGVDAIGVRSPVGNSGMSDPPRDLRILARRPAQPPFEADPMDLRHGARVASRRGVPS